MEMELVMACLPGARACSVALIRTLEGALTGRLLWMLMVRGINAPTAHMHG
jgi:hypothetical protein